MEVAGGRRPIEFAIANVAAGIQERDAFTSGQIRVFAKWGHIGEFDGFGRLPQLS